MDSKEIEQIIRDNYSKEIVIEPDINDNLKSICTYNIDDRSMEYYVWWRTCIRKGEYPKGEESFLSFFVKELFVMEESEEIIEKWLRLLLKVYGKEHCAHILSDTLTEFRGSKCRFPDSPDLMKGRPSHYYAPLLLSGPSITLDETQIRCLAGYEEDMPKGFETFFSRVLEHIAEELWNEHDTNIPEYLSNRREEYIHPMLCRYGNKERIVLVDAPCVENEAFRQKFRRILLNSMKSYAGKGKNIKEESVVKNAISKTIVENNTNIQRPSEWHPERFVSLKEYDGRETVKEYNPRYEPHPWELPTIINNDCRCTREDNKPKKSELLEFSALKPKGPAKYVKCDGKPLYPFTLNENEKEFYLYWREQFQNGKYLATDRIYLGLFIYETIKLGDDAEKTMAVLMKLAENYDCELTKETCMSFALANNLGLPPYGDCVNDSKNVWTAYIFYDALTFSPIRDIPFEKIMMHIGNKNRKYAEIDRCGFRELANYILRRMDEYLIEKEGIRLIDLGDRTVKKMNVPIFRGMECYGMEKPLPVTIPAIFDSKKLGGIAYTCFMVALQKTCKNNLCSSPNPKDIDGKYESVAVGFAEEWFRLQKAF